MNYETLLRDHVGQFGTYQIGQLLLVSLPCILVSLEVLSWTFTGAIVPYRCVFPNENDSDIFWNSSIYGNTSAKTFMCKRPIGNFSNYWQSNATESCVDGYKFDHSEIHYNAIERWSIVCERGHLRSLIQSTYYMGQLIGSLVFGYLGDRFGRKIIFMVGITMEALAGLSMAFVPWWEGFAILRLITGLCHPAIFVVSNVISVELLGPSRRMLGSITTGIVFAIGQMLLAGLAYALRDYRYLQISVSGPALLFLVYWWIIPESPRWLINKGKFTQADKILRTAAKINKTSLPHGWWEVGVEMEKSADKIAEMETKVVKKNYHYADLLKTPQLRKRSLLNWYCWPAVSFVYYGISMNPSFLGGNRYSTFALSGFIEIPGVILAALIVNRIGRKASLVFGYGVSAIFLLITIAIKNQSALVGCVIIAKGTITLVYAVIYISTPELFPTPLRNIAMGSCSLMARCGSIAASYLALWLAVEHKIALVLTFGIISIVAAIFVCFLPETNGVPLSETVEEAEKLGKTERFYDFLLPKCGKVHPKSEDN